MSRRLFAELKTGIIIELDTNHATEVRTNKRGRISFYKSNEEYPFDPYGWGSEQKSPYRILSERREFWESFFYARDDYDMGMKISIDDIADMWWEDV